MLLQEGGGGILLGFSEVQGVSIAIGGNSFWPIRAEGGVQAQERSYALKKAVNGSKRRILSEAHLFYTLPHSSNNPPDGFEGLSTSVSRTCTHIGLLRDLVYK